MGLGAVPLWAMVFASASRLALVSRQCMGAGVGELELFRQLLRLGSAAAGCLLYGGYWLDAPWDLCGSPSRVWPSSQRLHLRAPQRLRQPACRSQRRWRGRCGNDPSWQHGEQQPHDARRKGREHRHPAKFGGWSGRRQCSDSVRGSADHQSAGNPASRSGKRGPINHRGSVCGACWFCRLVNASGDCIRVAAGGTGG